MDFNTIFSFTKAWRKLLQIAFIIAGIVSIFYLHQYLNPQAEIEQPANIPDFIVTDLYIIGFNIQGDYDYTLRSVLAQHYASDNHTDFKDPIGFSFSPTAPPWKITADFGQANSGYTQVHLWEHVVMHQPEGRNNNSSTLLTDDMMIYTKTKEAKTNAFVTAKQPGIIITSQGVYANLANGKVVLLKQARAIYSQ